MPKQYFLALVLAILGLAACKKNSEPTPPFNQSSYYEVGFKQPAQDWKDTSFVVRTVNTQLITQINGELQLPIDKRKPVTGSIASGSEGFNKNASHEFKWHLKDDDWKLADATIEIYDGRPYTDIDLNYSFWKDTIKRFGPWNSFIRKRLPGKP